MRCGRVLILTAAVSFGIAGLASAGSDNPADAGAAVRTRSASEAATDAEITLASAISPANVPAAPVTLAYKFKPGQFVRYTGSSRIQYRTELGDQYPDLPKEQRKFSNVQTNETETHYRVIAVDDQGNGTIEPVVERTKMTARMHDKEPVEFDSSKPVEGTSPFQAIRDVIGHPVARFQVSPRGKLLKSTIIDETAPKSLRDAAEKLDTRFPYLSHLPSGPVAVGDKWREEYTTLAVNNGLKQPIPLRRIHELVAIADGVAVIKFKTIVLMPVDNIDLEKQLMQQTPTGRIEFDIERGLILSYTSSINRIVMNAFGGQSLLQVTGESTEKLAPAEIASTRQDATP